MRCKQVYDQTVAAPGIVVVFFHSYDSAKSKEISKQYKDFAKSGTCAQTQFCIVDIDENLESVKELKIESAPHFVMYENGKITDFINSEGCENWESIKERI